MSVSRARQPTFGHTAQTRLLAAIGLVALIGGMVVVVMRSTSSDSGGVAASAGPASRPAAKPKPKPKPVKLVRVSVKGVGAYDPEGDRSENDSQAPFATDGNPTTAWKSEHYRSTFSKSGVGLVLDAGKPVKATRLVVTTDTPGYSAGIQVGSSSTGPWVPVSPSKTTTARTTFALKPRSARYLMVWITSMPIDGVAAVDEVAVTARR
jgi:F5/8 type C domain-containing protein